MYTLIYCPIYCPKDPTHRHIRQKCECSKTNTVQTTRRQQSVVSLDLSTDKNFLKKHTHTYTLSIPLTMPHHTHTQALGDRRNPRPTGQRSTVFSGFKTKKMPLPQDGHKIWNLEAFDSTSFGALSVHIDAKKLFSPSDFDSW